MKAISKFTEKEFKHIIKSKFVRHLRNKELKKDNCNQNALKKT